MTALLALAGLLPAYAQYTFTLNVSWSGNCSGYTAQMNQMMGKYKSQAITGFPTRELCEQTRAMCHQELGHIEIIYYDVKTGKEIKREATNCKLNVSTTPCTGHPMAGSVGTLNALGVSQGSSFYSSNTANEIQNWSEDDMERMLALNPEYKTSSPVELSMGDENTDLVRNRARKNAFILDTNKPFRSLNVGDDGLINSHSADMSIINTDWQLIRSTKKLPYNTIDEFAEGTTQQYNFILDNVLNLANMPLNNFEYNLNQCAYDIEAWYNSESIRLASELENAQKLHDIANFMLQYKGYLAITYINGMSDNPAAADNAARKAFGKTRDELAYESIEKMEKNLFEKYGMSSEDIAKLKKVIDDDNKVQDYVSKAQGLGLNDIGEKGVVAISEKMTDKGLNIDLGGGELSISKALDMGVLLNNDIALLGLSKEEKALENYVQSIKNQQNLIKEARDKETQKIGDLLTIVENSSQKIKSEVSKMSQRDKLDWANNANETLERVNSRKAKDSYDVFPDRFRNMYIREGTFIEYRGN